MKRIMSTLLLLALFCSFALIPFSPVKADTAVNRNKYSSLDHSKDDLIVETILSMEAGSNLFPKELGFNENNFGGLMLYTQYTNPEIVGWITTYHKTRLGNNNSVSDLGYWIDLDNNLDTLRAEYKTALPRAMHEVDQLIPKGATAVTIAHIVHDYLAATTVYDRLPIDEDRYVSYDYDAGGVFSKHYSCCLGYSLAYKYILNQYGIDCMVVTSRQSEHAWNMVKLGSDWYHVDVSGDDPFYDILGRVEHTYLFLSTETLLQKASNRSDFIVYPDDPYMVFTDELYGKDKTYETDQYWCESKACCHYYGDDLYTIGTDSGLYKNGSLYFMPDEHMVWHPYGISTATYLNGAHGRLCGIGNRIYMLSPHNIYSIDLTKNTQEIIYSHYNTETPGEQIYGLSRVNGHLNCTLATIDPTEYETWIQVSDPTPPDPPYRKAVDITLLENETVTLTDESGDYTAIDPDIYPDSAIAAVSTSYQSLLSTPAVPASVSAMSGFAAGNYLIGVSGSYLTRSGDRLTVTSDPESAALWTLSGSTSNATLSSGGYYLSHSTSGLSLSSSASNASWIYASGRFYFSQSKKVLFWTSTTNYYLVGGNSFTVSTSTSGAASAFVLTPGTPAVEGIKGTQLSITGVKAGTTRILLGHTLYTITVNAPKPEPIIQVITVYSVDTEGKTVAQSYTIQGTEGESYTVTPASIPGYTSPKAISGQFTSSPTASLTLTYTKIPESNIFTLDTDGINTGDAYMLVSSGSALGIVDGKLVSQSFIASGNNLSNTDSRFVWIIGSGYTLRNEATGQYLKITSSGSIFRRTYSLSLASSSSNWSASASGQSMRFSMKAGTKTCYLSYNGGFSVSTSSSSSCNISLYRKK